MSLLRPRRANYTKSLYADGDAGRHLIAEEDPLFAARLREVGFEEMAHLYAYWSKRRDCDLIPLRNDIDPVDLRKSLSSIFIVDVAGNDPLTWKIRLYGTALAEMCGQDLTGRPLGETPGVRTKGFDRYLEHYLAAADGRIFLREDTVGFSSDRHHPTFAMSVLLLPVRSEGSRATSQIFGHILVDAPKS